MLHKFHSFVNFISSYSVVGVEVSIVDFQATDPGSIPFLAVVIYFPKKILLVLHYKKDSGKAKKTIGAVPVMKSGSEGRFLFIFY